MKKISVALIAFFILLSSCFAEQCWILCQPDSFVNVRERAKKTSAESGRLECGDTAQTDGAIKNGFLHLNDAPTESGEGWISKGYIVYSEPVKIMKKVNVCSFNRVACWRYIGGKRRCWVTGNDIVMLYYVSEEWSVTNKGYIRTKYLGVNYDAIRMAERAGYGKSDCLHWEDNEGEP